MNYKDFDKQAKEIGVGNRCIVSIKGTEITDARLQKEGNSWFVCQDISCGVDCKDKLGYTYTWVIENINDAKRIDYIKPYEVKYKEGDVLVNED